MPVRSARQWLRLLNGTQQRSAAWTINGQGDAMGEGEAQFRFRAGLGALGCVCGLLFTAQAQGAQVLDRSPIQSAIARNQALNVSRTYRQGDQVELRTDYIQRPEAAGDSRGFLGLKMKSNLGDHLPVLQAELDYGSFDPQSSLALDGEDHRSYWLGAQSSWHDVDYGVSYQSMGRDFVPLAPVNGVAAPGTNRTDVWGQRHFGDLSVRTFAWHSTDQARDDNVGSRYANTAVGTAFNYVLSSAPHVDATLSYSRQNTTSLGITAPVDELTHNLYGSLSVRKDAWNATASSAYAYKADCTAADGMSTGTWTESVAASYAPHPNFSISPSFTFQDAPDFGNRSRIRTRSAVLALQFRPNGKPYLFTASGSMANQQNPAWSADATNFSTQAGVRIPLALGNPARHNGSLALQVNYSEATNAYASSDDFLVNLQLMVHEFN